MFVEVDGRHSMFCFLGCVTICGGVVVSNMSVTCE